MATILTIGYSINNTVIIFKKIAKYIGQAIAKLTIETGMAFSE